MNPYKKRKSNAINSLFQKRSTDTSNAFVPRPNSNFIKGTLHYLGTILMNTSPSNIKCSKKIFLNRNIINIWYEFFLTRTRLNIFVYTI